jgi:hypothetical protein
VRKIWEIFVAQLKNNKFQVIIMQGTHRISKELVINAENF